MNAANTLAFHQARPLSAMRPMGWAPVSAVAVNTGSLLTKFSAAPMHPELAALKFYLWQHAMCHIRLKYPENATLPDDVLGLVNDYYSDAVELTQRMFVYLTLICTREARHQHAGSGFFPEMAAEFGPELAKFQESISGGGKVVDKFLKKPPKTTFDKYCGSIRWNFFYPGAYSSAYGGPKWGAIATVLEKFVLGEYSAEMMLDTSFHLAHNGGPIFNKGLGFHHYDNHSLKAILDAQANGYLPSFIESANLNSKFLPGWLKTQLKKCVAVLGSDAMLSAKAESVSTGTTTGSFTNKPTKKKTPAKKKAVKVSSAKAGFVIEASAGSTALFTPYSKKQGDY